MLICRVKVLIVWSITALLLIVACSVVPEEISPTPPSSPQLPNLTDPPPIVAPEANLSARAHEVIPSASGTIIIPESAFQQALAQANYYKVDMRTRAKGIELAAAANEPRTVGVLGRLQIDDRPQTFHGTHFIITRNADSSADRRLIQSTDYYIAVVELSGTSPWIGTNAQFAVNVQLQTIQGRCCGPPTVCIPHEPPPDPCDLGTGFCPSPAVGITTTRPPQFDVREQNGLPLVSMELFRDKGPAPDLGGSSALGGGLPDIYTCTNVLDPKCDRSKPTCQPGDLGYFPCANGGGDSGQGSAGPGCGSVESSVRPQNVPKICTIIFDWESLPVECGGYCENCVDAAGFADELPPGCVMMEVVQGSNICSPPSRRSEEENNAMQAQVGSRDGTVCQPGGRGGPKICTTCEAGQCSQYAEKPAVDPMLATYGGDVSKCVGSDCEQSIFSYVLSAVEELIRDRADEAEEERSAPTGAAPDTTTTGSDVPIPENRDPGAKNPVGIAGDDLGAGAADQNPSFFDRWFDHFSSLFRPDQDTGADPVLIGDGSFQLDQADLSFDGSSRPFEFRRTYNSRSRDRSTLASNWSHNWDIRIQPLNENTTPTWARPYCIGSAKTTTCLLLHDGRTGGSQLFFFDMQSGLYMPQAGSTDTIAATGGVTTTHVTLSSINMLKTVVVSEVSNGWALRSADGHELFFNPHGYLISDFDRFGNGFSLEYERTALFELYDYYCYIPEQTSGQGTALREDMFSRRCAALAYLLGRGARPYDNSTAWQVTAADYPLPNEPALRDRLSYARAYLLHVLSLGPGVQSLFGEHLLRPVRVVDVFGQTAAFSRTLEFSYYRAPPLASSTVTTPTFDFAAMPQAELLKMVRSPVGTTLHFSYARPNTYPAALNELFLTQVDREDAPLASDILPAPPRSITYEYQWPSGPAQSYNYGGSMVEGAYDIRVFEKFRDYYTTFIGCAFNGYVCAAQLTPSYISNGDPVALARHEQNAYISDVADNIVHVVTSGVDESETRYTADPMSLSFDRVSAQRYGSNQAQQANPLPDDPSDNWQTTLPKANLTYIPAGPVTGQSGDRTDALPQEIRDRYPLETVTSLLQTSVITTLMGVEVIETSPTSPTIQACNYQLMETLRTELPSYRPTYAYTDTLPSEAHPDFTRGLYRSRIGCDQLAVAQLSDPTHNDLISTLVPITSTPTLTDHVALRVVGRRPTVAANMNRICTWTQLIDRDGDIHYYGLNYRGQVLVDVVKERASNHFIFAERLYNADGLVVQERRATRGAQPWRPIDGSTVYSYDEIDSPGNQGWNDWLPVFWSRRANLLRVREQAAGAGVIDKLEPAGAGTTTSTGRYTHYTYEPLFNQMKSIEEGSIERRRGPTGLPFVLTDVPHTRLDYVFDYQELALTTTTTVTSTFKPVLDHLQPWGFNWISKAGGLDYDYQAINGWQLPLTFYDRDINGDGVQGFGYGSQAYHRARGVPILAIRRPAKSTTDIELSTIIWAPHGMPAVVRGPDGTATVFEYYSAGSATSAHDDVYGRSRPPTDQEVSIGFRGLLARVRAQQFTSSYSTSQGPRAAPCPSLAGPYQWLLPASCSANPRGELEALGLPTQTVDAILSSTTSGSPDRSRVTAFSYSDIGLPRFTSVETRTTHIVRDIDGRVRQITDPIGSTTVQTYTLQGFPQRTSRVDASGKLLADGIRQFDNEGRVIYECTALAVNGCSTPGTTNLPGGIVERYAYWPEGSLRTMTDTEGLVTEFGYNERQLLVAQRTLHPQYPATLPRLETHTYNHDGDMLSTVYGYPSSAASGTTVLTETWVYDGLRRPTTYTTTRGYAWQFAYSNRDLLTHYKRDDVPYHVASPSSPSWETVLQYDPFGRLLVQQDNGLLTARYMRTNRGLSYRFWAAGQGEVHTTYDLLGRPVWTQDAAGNQTVVTFQDDPYIATSAIIRTDGAGQTLTTATIDQFDALGLPIESIEYGSGDVRRWTWQRDGSGFVVEARNPQQYATSYERNLLGWTTAISETRVAGASPAFDVTRFEHNPRGQVTKVTDPGNQVSEIFYDPFGAVERQVAPGQPQVSRSYIYDLLGRLELETRGTAQIQHRYDSRGDPFEELMLAGSVSTPLIERVFDDMGRIRRTSNTNPALSWLPRADRTVSQRFDYDSLGRVQTEELQVGSGFAHAVSSDWTVIGDGWRRKMSYNAGAQTAEWWETFDPAGRLERKDEIANGAPVLKTSFDWLGEIYLGRTQDQLASQSPFREQREIDHFGSPLGWRYAAIDVDQSQNPVRSAEGANYCGGQWVAAECARPLLTISTLRDVMGRIASLNWQFGHPVIQGNTLISTNHPQPWRGYTYNPMGELHQSWEHAGVGTSVTPSGLESHHVTAANIQQLGVGSELWEYERETTVGSPTAIVNPSTGVERWSLPTPRGPGHQIQQVEIDGATSRLTYDSEGRIATYGARSYVYDPRGQLAEVRNNGQRLESYLYAADGRLAAVIRGAQTQPATVFAYDGDQMVAGYDVSGRLLWEAAWGPGLDQLLLWRDRAGATGDHIPLVDHRNSVVGTWNSQTQRLVETAEYNPEGRILLQDASGKITCRESGIGQNCTNPSGMPFGFVSAWRSEASGLVFMRNRWYAPELGQFISRDPLGYVDSYDPYAFVAFDPINRWDPWGLGSQGFADNPSNPSSQRRALPEYRDRKSPGTHSFGYYNPGSPASIARQNYLDRTPLRDRAIHDQQTRSMEQEIFRERAMDEATLYEWSIFKFSGWTGGNEMARAYTGETEWAEELSLWERVKEGVSGVTTAGGWATTTISLGKVFIAERQAAVSGVSGVAEIGASSGQVGRVSVFNLEEGIAEVENCVRCVSSLVEAIAKGKFDRAAIDFPAMANDGHIGRALGQISDNTGVSFGKRQLGTMIGEGDFVVFIDLPGLNRGNYNIARHVLFGRNKGGVTYFYDPQIARKVRIGNAYVAYPIRYPPR